jgi:hypothetical protein
VEIVITIVPWYATVSFDEVWTKQAILNSIRHLAVIKSLEFTSYIMMLEESENFDSFDPHNKKGFILLDQIKSIYMIIHHNLIRGDDNRDFFYISESEIKHFQEMKIPYHVLTTEEYEDANRM